ncbi:MAG TPA: hypothetical protein VEH81_14095 [Ktedonobacteraceae bacterium]|nr:hypothetical protein [Ktedonobacteraceae bacterium]
MDISSTLLKSQAQVELVAIALSLTTKHRIKTNMGCASTDFWVLCEEGEYRGVEYKDIPPTGKQIAWIETSIDRIADG